MERLEKVPERRSDSSLVCASDHVEPVTQLDPDGALVAEVPILRTPPLHSRYLDRQANGLEERQDGDLLGICATRFLVARKLEHSLSMVNDINTAIPTAVHKHNSVRSGEL